MNILITGANGFLGRRVVPLLLRKGYKLRALVIPEEDTTYLAGFGKKIEIVRGDITKPETPKTGLNSLNGGLHHFFERPIIYAFELVDRQIDPVIYLQPCSTNLTQ